MQNPTLFQFQQQQQPMKPHFPEQEQLKCPRCDSINTKFCYYNNYNLSQPRHFCKNCKRYWTKGGTLRNIPVGGASRKTTKRSSTSTTTTTSKRSTTTTSSSVPDPTRVHIDPVVGVSESFSSLLESTGRFGSMFEGLNSSGSGLKMGEFSERMNCDPVMNSDPGNNNPGSLEMMNTNGSFLGLQNGSDWNDTSHGWSDLAIYTPGSTFQ